MSEFWCQSLSNWASLDPAAGRSGWWEESGIFGTWVTFQHIHSLHALSLVVFFLLVSFHPPPPLPVAEKKEKETTACMACRGAEPIRNAALKLPSALCQPAGGPWEFKTQMPGQNQETHRCPPLVSCLSVMQRSHWLSITPQHAGVAKQPRCIKKRNKRAERQNSQRVKMLRDETQKVVDSARPANPLTASLTDRDEPK